MRIFISTGEVSGDLQGGLLVEGLHRQAAASGISLEITALGGDRMADAGATLLGNTKGIGSVGLLEALPFILPTLQIQQKAKKYLRDNPPDAIVLIDYVGPNETIGRYARKHLPQVPIIYYIAPQHWIWAPLPKYVDSMIAITDRLLAIFPEEARFFEERGVSVNWVGHPLLDRMQNAPTRSRAREELGINPDETAIAIFPVSRAQEIKYLFPVLFAGAKLIQDKLPETRFLIPLSLPQYRKPVQEQIERHGLQARILEGKSLEAMAAADLAISKSGTVNLETALMGVPQVVVYRLSPITLGFARRVLKYPHPFLSPPNLLLMEPIVPELFQEDATPENVAQKALEFLLNPERREKLQHDYQRMRACLGEVGVCDRAAREILQFAGNTNSE
ncbi:lipid-A-disaccharide synthase [Lusitaniella coriacea LEGE 07157]|uniref:Lipid-A-disaccharide synthase n=1 Tax=Lusitaniella coriacea LEGE 07157 TaxID=945747 RepID=A0A8J7JFY9_9CYAN|nr:lipid-A-disaccharide synthase [Lusitaniella coriacea]MBE9119130.1 lipid-A-disaccharide synthase [Lusitaniella coriacea LEGE 07157]